ncbi:MAG: sensor histidine kinase [Candidatus Eiseniibacteriota bacterium]
MNPDLFELELERVVGRIRDRLEGTSNVASALAFSLRATRDFFGGATVCFAVCDFGQDGLELTVLPEGDASWDPDVLSAFLRFERITTPRDTVLALVHRHRRPWAVLGARRPGMLFERTDARGLSRIARQVSQSLHTIDRERVIEVRSRLDRKIIQQIAPKDLFYQILDGLRTLASYDHSSALFMFDRESGRLRLVAEQIAVKKAKSTRIGLSLATGPAERALLERETVFGYDRDKERWSEWNEATSSRLASLLDYNRDDTLPREATILVAPLAAREGVLGLIKLAGCGRGRFGGYEAGLLAEFTPLASIAVQNAQRVEAIHARMLEREKQLEIANLARYVSHDVNHNLGVALPTVQQLLYELENGRTDRERWITDLKSVQTAIERSHRIFRGMLRSARGTSDRGAMPTSLARVVSTVLDVLGGSLARAGVTAVVEIPVDVAAVRAHQSDLETLLFNLILNARDAMPEGGTITVRVLPAGARIEVQIEDTGCGIPKELLGRIHEAFFTTKAAGNGLGLTICRWILWDVEGEMAFDSEPGRGTRVRVLLPAETNAPATAGSPASAAEASAAAPAEPA